MKRTKKYALVTQYRGETAYSHGFFTALHSANCAAMTTEAQNVLLVGLTFADFAR